MATAIPVQVTIGGVGIYAWKGWFGSVQNIGSEFRRIGQAGTGAEVVGTKAESGTGHGWIPCTTQQAAIAAAKAVEALRWTTQAVTDHVGRTLPRVLIKGGTRATPTQKRGPMVGSATAQSTWQVEVEIEYEVQP